jgi:hypothetical protein
MMNIFSPLGYSVSVEEPLLRRLVAFGSGLSNWYSYILGAFGRRPEGRIPQRYLNHSDRNWISSSTFSQLSAGKALHDGRGANPCGSRSCSTQTRCEHTGICRDKLSISWRINSLSDDRAEHQFKAARNTKFFVNASQIVSNRMLG